jgi:hypothetical protein
MGGARVRGGRLTDLPAWGGGAGCVPGPPQVVHVPGGPHLQAHTHQVEEGQAAGRQEAEHDAQPGRHGTPSPGRTPLTGRRRG